ncbi:MAG: glycosyltransferase family 2 protein [Ramlibacter sp.]
MSSPGPAPDLRAETWACVVCHHPDVDTLRRLLAVLEPQVAQVLVIDNSPGQPALGVAQLGSARHVPMSRNTGTAGAMNEAWRIALQEGARYMVSFDQDSHPGPQLVKCLSAAFGSTSALAAVGPAWVDARTGKPMRLLRPVRFLRRHAPAPIDGLVEVDHVITSGSLVSAQAYRAVGPFNEDLFLDYVDVEWSLRARAKGYTNTVAAACTMAHSIGERMIALAGRQLAVHRPQRSYLQLRNHLLLWRQAAIPRSWLLSDAIQVAGKLSALLLLAPDRMQRLRWLLRGAMDGLRGRGGPPP